MKTRTIFFISLLLVGISQGPTLAHLLELPHKIRFSAADYLIVQQIYRDWFLLGIVEIIALFSTGALCVRIKRESGAFIFSLMAFVCLIVIQLIFWFFT